MFGVRLSTLKPKFFFFNFLLNYKIMTIDIYFIKTSTRLNLLMVGIN